MTTPCRRAARARLSALAAVLTLTACATTATPVPASAPATSGTPTSSPPGPSPSEIRGVPVTPRAIAALMLEHLPGDYSSARAAWVYDDAPKGFVGAELRYHPSEGDDGDLVRVTLAPTERPPTCAGIEHCVELDGLGDAKVYLSWELEAPEEDPGLFTVWTNRPGETVSGMVSGPVLKADPRTRPGFVTVETLRAVVVDERLRLLVTPSAIAAGDQVRHWEKD